MTDNDLFVDPLAAAQARARASIGAFGSVNPDEHATALKLADRLGATPEAAGAALRARPQQAKDIANGADAALQQTRHLPRWLTDPNNAALAHDQVAQLAKVEAAIGSHKDVHSFLGGAFVAGSEDIGVGQGVLGGLTGVLDPDTAAEIIGAANDKRTEFAKGRPESGLGGFAFDVARGFPSMVPALGAAALGGAVGGAAAGPAAGGLVAAAPFTGPAAPLLFGAAGVVEAGGAAFGAGTGLFAGFALTGAGGTAESLLGAEVDLSDRAAVAAKLRDPEVVGRIRSAAFKGGVASAAVMQALQAVFPPGAVLSKAAGKGLLAKAGAVLGEQAAQTGIMEAGGLAGEFASTGTVDVSRIPEGLAHSAGAALPFVAHGALHEARAARLEAARERRAEVMAVADHAALTEAVEAAKATPVRTRNQERFAKLVQSAADGADVGAVYVNREGWDRIQIAAGKAPAVEAERLTGSRTAYEEATRTGTLEVPYGRALAILPDDPLAAALLEHATVRAGGLTLKEAEAAGEARQKAAEAVPEPVAAAEDVAALEARQAELEAELGVPEGASLLFQSGKAEPSEGAAPSEQIKSEDSGVIPTSEQSPLRAAADAIEAAPKPPGVVGRLLGREASPAAQAVRDTLGGSAHAAPRTGAVGTEGDAGRGEAGEVGGAPRTQVAEVGGGAIDALARAAQRDPAGTAAKLRELADIRDRQGPAPLVAKLTAAIRAAGGKKPAEVARVLSAFVDTMRARFPEVSPEKWDALMVRFAKGEAPDGALQHAARGAYDRATRTIHIFETADASTAIHESSHWMVDVIGTLAKDEPALAEMWDALGRPETVEAHEKLARQFEAYVMTGDAPSPKLRRAFAVLRQIMLRVYQTVQQILGVDKIPAETRAIFDRMLATDAEIASAEAEHGAAPVMTREEAAAASKNDPAVMALFDANAEKLAAAGDEARDKLTRKIMADMAKEQKARRATTLANLRDEERAKYEASPAAAVRDSKIKLDRETLRAEYDKDTVAALESAGVVADEGLSAQAAAEVFGFPSGGDLLNALAVDPEKAIDASARQRLATEHPELYRDPEARRAEARRAVTETDRGAITAAEIRALKALDRAARPAVKATDAAARAKAAAKEAEQRAAYDAIPTQAEARAVAAEKIARMPVGEIKPRNYLAAERKARTLAKERAKVGDHLEAAQALGQALVNGEIHREAVRTVKQAASDTKSIAGTQSPGRQETIGKAGGEWQAQVNKLAAIHGLGAKYTTEVSTLPDWLAALDKQAGTDGNVFLPFVAEWLKAERVRPWSELTGEQLHDLRITVESIADIASARSKAHAKGETDNLLDRAASAVAQIEATHPKLDREFQSKPTWPQKFAAEHSPIDRYVYEIDGGPGGPLAKAILFPRNEGEAELEVRRVAANKSWKPAFAEFSTAEKATMGHKQPVAGVSRRLSHENRLMLVLYEGHEGGRQQNRNTFSEAEIDAIKRTMTAADVHWLNETWRFSNETWPELKDHMQRNYGVVPPKVEAMPFQIGDLKLTGGYSKIKHFGERAAQQSIEEIAGDLARGAAVRSTVRLGARFERQENVTRELRYDFGVVMEGHGEAITALALTERLYDINFVLRQSAVRDAIIDRHGQEVYDQFKSAMAALAGGHLKRQSSGEQLANYLRTGTIIAKLGFKVGTQVLNATGIANSVEGLGHEVLKEAAQLSLDPSGFHAAATEMWAESSTMSTRAVSASREQVDIAATLNKRFDTTFLRELPMMPMAAVQLWVDLPTYRVAKRKALAEGHSATDAVRIAEQAVKDYQGSGFPADMPAIMRDHKYMTLFMGFLNRTINLGVRRANMTEKSAAGLIRLGATAVVLFGLPAAVQQAYNRFARGDDNDDPFWWSTAKDAAANLAGGVAWARDLVAAARYDSYGGPGSLSVLSDFGKAARGVADADISERDMQAIANLAGTVAWLPTAQAIEMWRGFEAAMQGDAPPTAVVTGPPRRIR